MDVGRTAGTSSARDFRSPELSEIDELARLDRAVYGDFAFPATLWRQLADVAGPLLLVASERQELTAYGVVVQASHAGAGWLLVLGVRADRRGRGVGTAIARALVERAADQGIQTVRATVAPDNAIALRLYHGLGFTRERAVEAYFGPGKDRIVMCRHASDGETDAGGDDPPRASNLG
jgi:ribosomal protein S18 acetylase RimI-like enzyme